MQRLHRTKTGYVLGAHLIFRNMFNGNINPSAFFKMIGYSQMSHCSLILQHSQILLRPRHLFSLIHSKNTCSLSEFSEQSYQPLEMI